MGGANVDSCKSESIHSILGDVGRQLGGKCSPKHPENICRWETAGGQVGNRQASLEISRICKTKGRQVGSYAAQRPRASTRHLESTSSAAKIIQHTWKPWGTSGSVSHADQRAPTLYLATVKDKQDTSTYRSKSGTPIIRWIMITLNTQKILIYIYINSAL